MQLVLPSGFGVPYLGLGIFGIFMPALTLLRLLMLSGFIWCFSALIFRVQSIYSFVERYK
jgi:hypothetical protein